jgi:hypothetical protein
MFSHRFVVVSFLSWDQSCWTMTLDLIPLLPLIRRQTSMSSMNKDTTKYFCSSGAINTAYQATVLTGI